jgi:hypothetical protein
MTLGFGWNPKEAEYESQIARLTIVLSRLRELRSNGVRIRVSVYVVARFLMTLL